MSTFHGGRYLAHCRPPQSPDDLARLSKCQFDLSEGPVAGDELCEFSFDFDGEGAVEADVLVVGWGDMGQNLVVDRAARGASFGDGQAQVFGRPSDAGVGDHREAQRLFGLVFVVTV